MTEWEIALRLGAATLIGGAIGLNRKLHHQATGVRTLGLVALGSALIVLGAIDLVPSAGSDPNAVSRVVQGVLTGIGFLGAGVIMREGFNISGLTTAASIWASSVIGVMVGVGFYMGAMGLAALCACSMIYLTKVEAWLPSRHAIAITMRFKAGYKPQEPALRAMALQRGYEIAGGSMMIGSEDGMQEWRFVAIALNKHTGAPMAVLSAELAEFEGIHSFQLTHARN